MGLITDIKALVTSINAKIPTLSGDDVPVIAAIDQVTANANEVVVKSQTAPATLPLPTGAATDTLQTEGNASLSSIDCKSYKGKDRTTTTGAAEELTIPASSKKVILSCAPSSQAYIELNADASTSSPLYFEDPFGPITLDLGSVTKLSAWVVAGNLGAVFYG